MVRPPGMRMSSSPCSAKREGKITSRPRVGIFLGRSSAILSQWRGLSPVQRSMQSKESSFEEVGRGATRSIPSVRVHA